jgi:hypothetical protein
LGLSHRSDPHNGQREQHEKADDDRRDDFPSMSRSRHFSTVVNG